MILSKVLLLFGVAVSVAAVSVTEKSELFSGFVIDTEAQTLNLKPGGCRVLPKSARSFTVFPRHECSFYKGEICNRDRLILFAHENTTGRFHSDEQPQSYACDPILDDTFNNTVPVNVTSTVVANVTTNATAPVTTPTGLIDKALNSSGYATDTHGNRVPLINDKKCKRLPDSAKGYWVFKTQLCAFYKSKNCSFAPMLQTDYKIIQGLDYGNFPSEFRPESYNCGEVNTASNTTKWVLEPIAGYISDASYRRVETLFAGTCHNLIREKTYFTVYEQKQCKFYLAHGCEGKPRYTVDGLNGGAFWSGNPFSYQCSLLK